MFRRKRKGEDPEDPGEPDVDVDGSQDTEPEAATADAPPERPTGPWDVEDAPDDELERIDLGGLRIPMPPGTEVRVDVNPDGGVVAATLVQGDSSLQINAFAAPRTAGIWDEVRAEIAAALEQGGGRSVEAQGVYGIELRAAVPADEQGGLAPARFLGVDGPRWFVRALVSGPAALDPEQAVGLEAALRQVVVVRGSEAMVVRDPLPLALPKQVAEQAAEAVQSEQGQSEQGQSEQGQSEQGQSEQGQPELAAQADEAGAEGLPQMPQRGPEITETR